jgi:hypothetical protein
MIPFSVKDNSWFFSMDIIKDYFDVTNSYVLSKLKLIIFPVTVKVLNILNLLFKSDSWIRKSSGSDFNN